MDRLRHLLGSPRHAPAERAAAMVEFAIIVPLILVLISIAAALGSLLLTYHRMSSVSYEGARLAARTSGLEVRTGQTSGVSCVDVAAVVYNANGGIQTLVASNPAACPGQAAVFPTFTSQHKLVHDRTNILMALARISFGTNRGWRCRVEYRADSAEVVVSLSATYPFFWGFSGTSFPLTVSTSLPYLAK